MPHPETKITDRVKLVEAYVDRYRPRASHGPTSQLQPLTAREREILTLVGTGNTDFAQRLTISEDTVELISTGS